MGQHSNLPVTVDAKQLLPLVKEQRSAALRPHLSWVAGLGLMVCAIFSAALGLYQLTPPDKVPATAPLTEFSSGRAMKHLQAIAQEPHPIGSPEHTEVREYLLRELTAMGLNAEVQKTTAVPRRGRHGGSMPPSAGVVHNVVARLYGTDHSKAILLAAHYDSVPTGPGASDNGAAVAAMLETLRALKATSPLKNDVIFLFTDGEEAGLLGAAAFVAEHPWVKDVGLVLNFEARGNSGPSLMFETSTGNGWLMKEFAKAAPYPVTTSLSYEIYKLLPNDTDFTIFKDAGFAGFNFSYIDGYAHYHTATDSIETIDERSLQHHGSYMLSLTRHFANLNLENSKGHDLIYFNVLVLGLIMYSYIWSIILTSSTALLFLIAIGLGLRSSQLSILGIGLGSMFLLLSLVITSAIVIVLWWGIRAIHVEYQWMRSGDTYNSTLYIMSFVFIAIAITSGLCTLIHKKTSMQNLAVGSLIWWMILMILTSIYLPGASYLFTWPLMFSSIGMMPLVAFKDQKLGAGQLLAMLTLWGIPAIVLLTPIIYLLFVSLSLRLSGAVMVMVVLLFGLFTPHFCLMTMRHKWLLPSMATLGSIGFMIAASLTAGFDSHQRKPNSLFYSLNVDTSTAIWASADAEPDAWTAQFLSEDTEQATLPEFFPLSSREFLRSRAPLAPFTAPSLVLLADYTRDNVRTLDMQITSPRQAPVISLYVDARTEVLGAMINGKPIQNQETERHGTSKTHWGLRVWAPPPEGLSVTLQVPASQPIELRVVDQSFGLPEIPGASLSSRPDYMMPTPFGFGLSDAILVSKSFAF